MKQFKSGREAAEYLFERLQTITKANGYKTDIGLRVLRGKRKIDDSYVPCAVLIEGEDRPVGDAGLLRAVNIAQDYALGGYVACDPDHPNDAAHDVIEDIKRAVFQVSGPAVRDRVNVQYRGRDIGPRTDGGNIVFALVHITMNYTENLAEPV